MNRQLRSAEHYALAARRCFEKLSAQDVGYAEVTLSAGVILWKEQNFHAIFDALVSRGGCKLRFRCDGSSTRFGSSAMKVRCVLPNSRSSARTTGSSRSASAAMKCAVRPSGSATSSHSRKSNGLALVPHAGETDGPASIWACLELGADRIGHGIRAAEDPELMRRLRDDDIPLEVCITSNVCTGAVPSLDANIRFASCTTRVCRSRSTPMTRRCSGHRCTTSTRSRATASESASLSLPRTASAMRSTTAPTSFSSASSSLPASDQRP